MGAIKDIFDLVKELESHAKEKRDIDLVHKIQSLALSVQSDYANVVERDIGLVQENAELKRKLEDLQSEEIRIHPTGIEFRRGKRTDGKWAAFCPVCHLPADTTTGFVKCPNSKCGWTTILA